jgi:hypothetical protein
MIDPKAYTEFLEQLEALMQKSHSLQLFRTRQRLHQSLLVARGEIPEVIPTNLPVIKFVIGPVEDQ